MLRSYGTVVVSNHHVPKPVYLHEYVYRIGFWTYVRFYRERECSDIPCALVEDKRLGYD